MTLAFTPSVLKGKINAPTSKSMAHRYLLCAALSGQKSTLSGIESSEDILATLDCLKASGVEITHSGNTVTLEPRNFMKTDNAVLECRESGSTLRFFIPLALTTGKSVTFCGSERLFERPLSVYEEICRENGFSFIKNKSSLTLSGCLRGGSFRVKGNISSQFITGLIFALVHLNEASVIEVVPPFESRSYVLLTVSVLKEFGADIEFSDENTLIIKPSVLHGFSGSIEGDYSNAAFADALNYLGSHIEIGNLKADSLQGDRVYKEYFEKIAKGTPRLDIRDCPDLAPVLTALSALKNGAVLTGTDRLKDKESDRGKAMHEELMKLGGGIIFGDNEIIVPKMKLRFMGQELSSHNDHRIVMALSVILLQTGGVISGAEAVNKSYPAFFDEIKRIGAGIELL